MTNTYIKIKRSFSKAYKKIHFFANKYPIETNIIFLIFGTLISAATFWNFISEFLTLKIQVWHVLIGILILIFLFFLIKQKTINNILKNKYSGLLFVLIVFLISFTYLFTRPNSKKLVIRETHLTFPVTTDNIAKFLARQAIYKNFDDLYKMNLEHPFFFNVDSKTVIDSIKNVQSEYLENLVDSLENHPYLQIDLFIDNRLGVPTEIFKVTGELRFGDESDFLGGKIRHIEGRNIITNKYLNSLDKYNVEFNILGGKRRIAVSAAGEKISIFWQGIKAVSKYDWFRNALVFELRGQEFMDYFNDDYQRILSRMFETTIEKEYSKKYKEINWQNFKLVVLQVDIEVHHTYGVQKYRKTFAIGTVKNVKISDILMHRSY